LRAAFAFSKCGFLPLKLKKGIFVPSPLGFLERDGGIAPDLKHGQFFLRLQLAEDDSR